MSFLRKQKWNAVKKLNLLLKTIANFFRFDLCFAQEIHTQYAYYFFFFFFLYNFLLITRLLVGCMFEIFFIT